MADRYIVLIGAPNRLEALRERTGASGEILSFSDTEPLAALEAITTHRPQVVALERLFAATSRGAALINRIKSDPALASAEIRIVSHDSEYSRVSPRRQAADAVAVEAPLTTLDYRGTRRAPRVRMIDGTEAIIDGTPALLVDLSAVGAQVISTAVLRPNQRIRLALADDAGVLRFNATISWASFEMSKATPRYRAGVEFRDADADAVEAFSRRHRKS